MEEMAEPWGEAEEGPAAAEEGEEEEEDVGSEPLRWCAPDSGRDLWVGEARPGAVAEPVWGRGLFAQARDLGEDDEGGPPDAFGEPPPPPAGRPRRGWFVLGRPCLPARSRAVGDTTVTVQPLDDTLDSGALALWRCCGDPAETLGSGCDDMAACLPACPRHGAPSSAGAQGGGGTSTLALGHLEEEKVVTAQHSRSSFDEAAGKGVSHHIAHTLWH